MVERRGRLRTGTTTGVGAAVVFAMFAAVTGCAEPEGEKFSATAPVLAADGARAFERYCASCHGSDARGGGAVAAVLRLTPLDLTKIASRRQGVFPASEVRHHIDGRIEHIAHGTRGMPVWGERFSDEVAGTEARDELVRGRLYALVDYLQSIQDPAPTTVR